MTIDRELLARQVEQQVLGLRELLVRHDENMKAHRLLESVPYWCWDRPLIAKARAEQEYMVAHALEPEAYLGYYRNNPHERPFEEQYGLTPENAHEHLYRVEFLREGLSKLLLETNRQPRVLDLTGNDGWMAANLALFGATCDMCELNTGAVTRAMDRAVKYRRMGNVWHSDFHQLRRGLTDGWQAVVLFETLEHLPDPVASLRKAADFVAKDGRLYVSTPDGAVEDGDLPTWDLVERKGHLWAWSADQFKAMLERIGEVTRFEVGPDRVAVAEVRPAG